MGDMARKLVVCCDGTWNTPRTETNVFRTYRFLREALGSPAEVSRGEGVRTCGGRAADGSEVVLFYDAGVGTRRLLRQRRLLADAPDAGVEVDVEEQAHAGNGEQQREQQSGRWRDPSFGQRPLVGARHDRIDAPVHHMIDRCGAPGAERDTEIAEHQNRPGHSSAGGEEHAHQRGDEHQQHHLRLGQLQVIAPAGVGAAFAE